MELVVNPGNKFTTFNSLHSFNKFCLEKRKKPYFSLPEP